MRILTVAILFLFLSQSVVRGQEPAANPLSQDSGSRAEQYANPIPWRVQRARFRAEQAAIRQEYYKWIGYDPMRPVVNSNATSNSRYVPVYFRAYYPMFNHYYYH